MLITVSRAFINSLLFLASIASIMSSTTSPVTVIGQGCVEQKKSAVIIGAGPVGLAASLMLEKCGYTDITIVEKRPRDSFESSKAYLYLIDLRGQRITDLIG